MTRSRPIAALVLFLAAVGCSSSPEPSAIGSDAEDSSAVTWVGGQSCFECHAKQAEQWNGSHHDLAMQEADESTVLGDFDDSTFEYAGITSTFFRRAGKHIVRTDGPDGELHDYEIAYVFGVVPLQQYLIEFPGGRYQVLSICWDTLPISEGGQRWFHLYPDEAISYGDELHWTGPNQNWNYMCAECHSTRLRKNYDAKTDSFTTTWTDIDVSCEACHGPGSRHLAWAEAGQRNEYRPYDSSKGLMVQLGDTDGAEWLFDEKTGIAKRNPSRTSQVEIDTCARCHSRRSQFTDDYVHGRSLLQTHRPALLTERLYHADGQILDEVYVYGSFLQSLMFNNGVTCGDCHDPHSLELREEGNVLCAKCHLATKFDTPSHHFHKAGSKGARCVVCHMPSRTYMVVDPRLDHSMRIPRPDLTVELGTPNACADCHADHDAMWAAAKIVEWYGPERKPHYGSALDAGRRHTPGAGSSLAALIDKIEMPGIVRATAAELLQRNPDPESLSALEHALQDKDPLVRFSGIRALESADAPVRAQRVVPLLADPVRLVRMEAGRILADLPTERLSIDDRELRSSAIDEYRDSLAFNADRAESHVNLGLLEIRLRHLDVAEREYRKALEISPRWIPAYVNLADLFRLQGRDDEGERLLRGAATLAPDNADVHHALGLLLARDERLSEAVASLRRAAELNPDNARYAYVYGVALQSSGQIAPALETLERAHDRHPTDPDIVVALTTINRDAGNIARALIHARELVKMFPEDPGARRLQAELETLSGRNGARR